MFLYKVIEKGFYLFADVAPLGASRQRARRERNAFGNVFAFINTPIQQGKGKDAACPSSIYKIHLPSRPLAPGSVLYETQSRTLQNALALRGIFGFYFYFFLFFPIICYMSPVHQGIVYKFLINEKTMNPNANYSFIHIKT